MKADGWATAFMLLDLNQIKKVLQSQQDLEALILYLDENNELQRFISEGFKNE